MKNLTVKPFKSHLDALNFLEEQGCFTTTHIVDRLVKDGYIQYRKWHIVIDPHGEIVESNESSIIKDFYNAVKALFSKIKRLKK